MYNHYLIEKLTNDKLQSLREEGMRSQELKRAGIHTDGMFVSLGKTLRKSLHDMRALWASRAPERPEQPVYRKAHVR